MRVLPAKYFFKKIEQLPEMPNTIFNQNQASREFAEKYKRLSTGGLLMKSDANFCKEIGWNASSLSLVLNGKRNAPYWVIAKFNEMYGSMYSGSDIQKGTVIRIIRQQDHQEYISCSDKTEHISSLPVYITLPYHAGFDFLAFEMISDRMAPTIKKGDILVGWKISRDKWDGGIQDGDVCAVVTSSWIRIYRCYKRKTGLLLVEDGSYKAESSISFNTIDEIWMISNRITTDLDNVVQKKMDELEKKINEIITKQSIS